MAKKRIIIGANYGDEGKGTVVATYTKHANGKVLNVLTNGGAQRAHTIFIDGNIDPITNKHFGSGTAFGADNYFAEQFILNPVQFVQEYDSVFNVNKFKNITFYRHSHCMWSTPWDMMANIIKNKNKFASCGMGIWETIVRYKSTRTVTLSEFFRMSDYDKVQYLLSIRMYYEKMLGNAIPAEFIDPWKSIYTLTHFAVDCEFMVRHTIEINTTYHKELFAKYDEVIFENGQGLLLTDRGIDESDRTPSDTTKQIAQSMLIQAGDDLSDLTVHYVTRPYLTRHGKGGMELGEDSNLTSYLTQDTNVHNELQGEFRYGKLDIDSLHSRILKDAAPDRFNIIIELTHCDEMDRLAEFERIFTGQASIRHYENKFIK